MIETTETRPEKSTAVHQLRKEYAAALEDYLSRQSEEPLQRAYELGRRAMQDGLGLLDVASMHGDALARLLSTASSPGDGPRMTRQASTFLAETLSRAELFLRGFQDALKELEASHQRLRLSERLAAIGTLSAGLGHDMANLLLPVRVRLEKLQREPFGPDIQEDLHSMKVCIDHLQNLSQGLRLLAMNADESRASEQFVYVEDWWTEVSSLFRNALPRNVELQHEFEADLPALRIAPHQLTQAVFNLIQNAAEILRETYKAKVTLTVERGVPGRNVRLIVADNGPGMSEETRRRCMEPFFTTKTRTLSTGLGLALLHNIICRVGGKVEIESEPGRGTTFVLTIPVIADDPHADRAGTISQANAMSSRKALVSVGDPRVSGIVQSLLRAMRFSVESGTKSREAQVWVVDQSGASASELKQFLQSDSRRRAVVLGGGAVSNGDQRQTVFVSDVTKMTSLREALESATNPNFTSGTWSNDHAN